MAFGPADGLRLGRAVDAVMLLGQVEPGDADRAVGPRRQASSRPCVVDIPEQVRLVMERRQEGVGRHLPVAERQRVIASSPSSPGIGRPAWSLARPCTLSTPSDLSTTTWSPCGLVGVDVELDEQAPSVVLATTVDSRALAGTTLGRRSVWPTPISAVGPLSATIVSRRGVIALGDLLEHVAIAHAGRAWPGPRASSGTG